MPGPRLFGTPGDRGSELLSQTSFSNLTVLCLARIIHKESELMWPRPWLPCWSLPQKDNEAMSQRCCHDRTACWLQRSLDSILKPSA